MFRITDERCFLRYKQNANCKPLPRATGQPSYNEAKDASESSFAQQSFLQKDSLLFSSIFSKVLLHFQTVNLNGLTDQNLLVLGPITCSIWPSNTLWKQKGQVGKLSCWKAIVSALYVKNLYSFFLFIVETFCPSSMELQDYVK